MIVKEEDSLRKKMKWSLITFVTEIVILLIFWGVPFFIMKDTSVRFVRQNFFYNYVKINKKN